MRTPWFRCDARINEDPRIAELPSDSARWAWIVTLGRAKDQRPQGVFPSLSHVKAALARHGRHVDALLSVGLLITQQDGSVVVRGWKEWQSDLSTPRVVAFRKRNETA